MNKSTGQPPASAELTALLDRIDECLEKGSIPAFLYNNDILFKAEMERIFARNWVFVAHESEIPNKGDFVLRRVGIDQVIVTRDSTGAINVLSNHCAHRGAHICQVDQGNASRFRCPYHGWVYKNNGDWAGAPHLKDAYGGKLDAKEYGLLKAPKVESYQGFIFTCLSENSQSFEDYLAAGSSVLDMVAGMGSKGGLKVIAPPERYVVKCDWKAGAENFVGDVYHVDQSHIACDMVQFTANLDECIKNTWRYQAGGGHAFLLETIVKWIGPFAENWGWPKEDFDFSTLNEDEEFISRNVPVAIGTFFPNFSYRRSVFQLTPGTEENDARPFTSFVQWQPIEPGLMEVWNWVFAWDHADPAAIPDEYTIGMLGFSSAGFLEMDDTANWEGSARVGKSPWHEAAKTSFKFHEGPPGYEDPHYPDYEWKGPGIMEKNPYNEAVMLDFWREYSRVLRGTEPPTSYPAKEAAQ